MSKVLFHAKIIRRFPNILRTCIVAVINSWKCEASLRSYIRALGVFLQTHGLRTAEPDAPSPRGDRNFRRSISPCRVFSQILAPDIDHELLTLSLRSRAPFYDANTVVRIKSTDSIREL